MAFVGLNWLGIWFCGRLLWIWPWNFCLLREAEHVLTRWVTVRFWIKNALFSFLAVGGSARLTVLWLRPQTRSRFTSP